MSWSIPTQIEKDIISGKAVYKTFQTGNGGQSVLPVTSNSYIVIFGYDFSPAGGGFGHVIPTPGVLADNNLFPDVIRWFETQQISFFNGAEFFPFIHHVDIDVKNITNNVEPNQNFCCFTVNNSPLSRQLYITSNKSVAITVGLILQMNDEVAGPIQEAIPVTDTTPLGLTYGGSGQVINIQTQYSSAGFSPVFTQPQVQNYEKYAFVAPLPVNPESQVYATPDVVNGMRDPSQYLNALGADFNRAAATQYYLNVHYAVYSETIPEQRG
jgi:hypothetical protein